MPRSATLRQSCPPFIALPDDSPAMDEPPAAARPGGAKIIRLVPVVMLRVGEYEVGDGFCPHLLGHPDIRY